MAVSGSENLAALSSRLSSAPQQVGVGVDVGRRTRDAAVEPTFW